MSVVSSELVDNICVVLIDNPPVNATSVAVRRGLEQAVQAAVADNNVRAIVLLCAGSTFIAGADIKEFGQPPQDPHLSVVIDGIENSAKPVVAGIQGTALGGGLEVALGCHYRVAAAKAKLGLPESTLGIIPGAGGIPRLLRLVDARTALEMVVGGKPIGSRDAFAAGLVDEISGDDVRSAAIAFARKLVQNTTPVRSTRELPVKAADPALFGEFRSKVESSHRGQAAPLACIDLVEAAQTEGFDASVAASRARFKELVASPQAKALRHAFFAERVATRPADLPTVPDGVKRAGVIGAGTMGTGIAMCFLNAGIPVVLLEENEKVLAASAENIKKTYSRDAEKGRITEAEMSAKVGQLSTTMSYSDLADCDIIIEAVFEDMKVKKEVFDRIGKVVKPETIVASNTSYLDINEIAAGSADPAQVVGMHFFSPAHIMKLLENVRAEKSAPAVLARIQALGKRLGKVSVMVGVSDGFVGNRMLSKRTRECFFLLEEGALPDQVDRVLYEFGFPMGQFQLNDLAGLDVAWRNRQSRLDRLGKREVANNILDEIYESGRRGQKSSSGFYKYDANRTRSIDPEINELIVNNALRRGLKRREISDEEIRERCLYSMINEGAKILDEGVASRPEEIDTIWINGYGFPRYRGGPMFYADQVGLKKIYERIQHYSEQVGKEYWSVSPLLERLALSNGTFYGG